MENLFAQKIYRLLLEVPAGKVTTYGALAKAAGRPAAARAVGRVLHKNPERVKVPCHRVVCSDGRLGGYAGGVLNKIRLLKREGILILRGKVHESQITQFNF